MPFLDRIHVAAAKARATIILAEAEDDRVLSAARVIERKGLAKLILLGDEGRIRRRCRRLGIALEAAVMSYASHPGKERLARTLAELRRHKGLSIAAARRLLATDTKYFAAMLVKTGEADGYVAGNECTTAETLRPALQLFGATEGFASSYFLMLCGEQPLLFADCALNISPDARQLAEIGVQSARSARRYAIRPRVAFLSFSTKGSAEHERAAMVREAARLAKRRLPHVPVDGELQFDAAWVPDVARRKAPRSPLKGRANVLIFPSLEAGNIAYKIAARMAGEEAIGPIIQGLRKPVNDLSRGCTVQEIVDVVAITAMDS